MPSGDVPASRLHPSAQYVALDIGTNPLALASERVAGGVELRGLHAEQAPQRAHAAVHVGLAALVFGIVEPHDLDDVARDAAGVVTAVGAARAGTAGHVAAPARTGGGEQEVGQAGPAGGLEPEERLLQLRADGAAERLAQAGIVFQAPDQAAQRAERAAFGVRVDPLCSDPGSPEPSARRPSPATGSRTGEEDPQEPSSAQATRTREPGRRAPSRPRRLAQLSP